MTDTAPRRAGHPKKIDRSMMAMLALLVVRIHKVERTPAVQAAILAYFTWSDHPHPDLMVDIYTKRILKELQRLEAGKHVVHPDIIKATAWGYKATGESVFGTPQELAQSVAKFLPQK